MEGDGEIDRDEYIHIYIHIEMKLLLITVTLRIPTTSVSQITKGETTDFTTANARPWSISHFPIQHQPAGD